jgi:uncharacterized protein YbjT (DUF2867 family)
MSQPSRTLVTGGTGTLGQALLPRLLADGHTVRATSRAARTGDDVEWVRMELESGTGIRAAVDDVDVIVHTATAPLGDTEAVDVEGTRRLLEAAAEADVENFVYISIVGIDDIPYSYYEAKLEAERAIEASEVPSTILRATQFYPFVDELLEMVARLPVWPLPTRLRIQPVDTGPVADRLVDLATTEAGGRAAPVGGPEVRTVGGLATAYREARGRWRPIVRVPVPTATFARFRKGAATCPEHDVGSTTWEEWLETEYATG